MRALPLLLAGIVLAAGCLGPAAKPANLDGGDDLPSKPVPKRIALPDKILFSPAQILGTLSGGVEPSVAIAPDGTVYITTPLALWRSDDGGKTYKPVGKKSCPSTVAGELPSCPGLEQYQPGMKGGGDADLWVTPDGRVHWLGLFDGRDNAIPYQVSADKGETWSPVVDLAGDHSGDREWITGRADGTLFANWRDYPPNGSPDRFIVMRASYDGGATWTEATRIAKDTRQGGVAVDPSSNALALAWDLGGDVRVAHSFDNGTTWESVPILKSPTLGHVFPVTAFDANGTLYAAFAHDRDGAPTPSNPVLQSRPMETPNLYLVVSHDKGLTWSAPRQINAPGTTAWFPWITAGADGRVILVWYQNDRGLPRLAADEVYVMAGMSMDADSANPTWKNVRVKQEPIHRGSECREQAPMCTRSLLDFFEVALHPKGYPIVAWAEDKDWWPYKRVSVGTAHLIEGPNFLE